MAEHVAKLYSSDLVPMHQNKKIGNLLSLNIQAYSIYLLNYLTLSFQPVNEQKGRLG